MKDGDLAQYVSDMEKTAFMKSIISGAKKVVRGAKEAGGVAETVAESGAATYGASRLFGSTRRKALKLTADVTKGVAKQGWKDMSRAGKGVAIGGAGLGVAGLGYGIKKTLSNKKE